ncbi:MAG: sugar phosphate isomerase/epimerase [Planctomycetota bacterium]|nr:sugar phosphate isomerase/epimerase [Planctomycetota bacterium]
MPLKTMNGLEFILAAGAMGLKRVQLCENLGFADESIEVLKKWAQVAAMRSIEVEIGMNGLSLENVLRHLRICEVFDAGFLRVVLGQGQSAGDGRLNHFIRILSDLAPVLETAGVKIGVENHFDLTTREIAAILDKVNHPMIGAVFDSTNAIGFIEKPADTLALLSPRLLSVHLKDYRIYKAEASYVMTGSVIGEGRQDVRALVRIIMASHPDMNFILEMTVKRREGLSVEEAIEEEKRQISVSLDNLNHILVTEGNACSNSR